VLRYDHRVRRNMRPGDAVHRRRARARTVDAEWFSAGLPCAASRPSMARALPGKRDLRVGLVIRALHRTRPAELRDRVGDLPGLCAGGRGRGIGAASRDRHRHGFVIEATAERWPHDPWIVSLLTIAEGSFAC
jgi:hypothetical protein